MLRGINRNSKNGYEAFYALSPTNSAKTWAYYKLGQTGSFATKLCEAYEKADFENKHRLEYAFPRLFGAASAWYYSEDKDKFIQDLLDLEETDE